MIIIRISPTVNVTRRLMFELANYDDAIQHFKNFPRTPPPPPTDDYNW